MILVFKGDIDEAVGRFTDKGWKLIERGKGKEEAWIILSDHNGTWALFKFRAGKDINGDSKTIVMYHRTIDRGISLF